MKRTLFLLLLSLILVAATNAQTSTASAPASAGVTEPKKKRLPVFRANKDQVSQAQKHLKLSETGKLSDADRDAIKTYQTANGLKPTGGLNRATLEKMNIALTDKQKLIPVNPNSYASADDKVKKPRNPIFRANKDQVTQVQKKLKLTETGKLSDADREAIKTYQSANGLKSTGTLNRVTLEKMNIALTDKQKEIPANPNSYASAGDTVEKEKKPRKAVFRASKDQIVLAQRMLKEKGFYAGDETGKLDPETRDGIKKFQESVQMKETGTLNRETLEKMNIELTEKQKAL